MIPVSEPQLGARELEYVSECVRTGWVSSAGKFIDEFETRWAAYCGRDYGIAVSSGTAALQLALECLELGPEDEVIIPSFTIISCALAVLAAGARPVLVDADPRNWGLEISQVAEKITSRTRAVMPVHMYGHPVDMDPLLQLAEKHGLALVEDAAEAHGAQYLSGRETEQPAWRRCGSFGTLSVFSFYANKPVTTGEGGMILTNDARLADTARSRRNLCFQKERRFYHEDLGWNFRLTNLQAALGVAQIERIDQIVERKRWIGSEYTRRLSGLRGALLATEQPWARSIYWMYGIVLEADHDMSNVQLAEQLTARGIETRPFFLGLHEQPALHKLGLFQNESYPVTERLARYGLYLPSGLTLTEGEIAYVCESLREILS